MIKAVAGRRITGPERVYYMGTRPEERICLVAPSLMDRKPDVANLTVRALNLDERFDGSGTVQAVLVVDLDFIRGQRIAIHEWLTQSPLLMAQIVLLAETEPAPAELQPLSLQTVRMLLPSDARASHIGSAVQTTMGALDHEVENLKLRSRLALSAGDLHSIMTVSQALATEKDFGKLIDLILHKVRELVSSDGGSIYLVEQPEIGKAATHLRFTRSALQLDADEFLLPIDSTSIAGYVAMTREPLIIDDVRHIPADAEYSFNSDFDEAHDYYTKSMMVLPMTNQLNEIIGVLQLINRKRNFAARLTAEQMKGDQVIPFSTKDHELAQAVAGQAAVAIENQRLLGGQRRLLESFIQLIAAAIDSKSDYTGAHCERVPILTEMLTKAACDSREGNLADFDLDEEGWYELRIAAGLHDCGKIVTPVHVMDKSTKLETIFDRIDVVRLRFEVLKRDAIIACQKELRKTPEQAEALQRDLAAQLEKLDEDCAFIEGVNIGGEFLADEKVEQLKRIARLSLTLRGQSTPALTDNEVYNLSTRRGTLTNEERLIINHHMVETVKMLQALPFPRNLHRVPEYACGHHEKMDGTGYPKGIYAGDMSIPARIMAIADVFEALTAQDRPYKKGKSLSETMKIMGHMKADAHLDPEIFNLVCSLGSVPAICRTIFAGRTHRRSGRRESPGHPAEILRASAHRRAPEAMGRFSSGISRTPADLHHHDRIELSFDA
ncbi:MAG: GAF domain-containing protein [Leptospiraceae bacterium]|nr:GAF domain-containing protein [Leptospiraceae bacterium]